MKTRTEIINALSLDKRSDLVNEMRECIKDCQDIDAEDVDNMTDEELITHVERYYEGGLEELVTKSLHNI